MFVPFGAAYLASFALRSVNAAITVPLSQSFALDAAALGLLTAAYFLAFSFTQLPLGGWLDRFRPRRVDAALLVFCALGCFVFALASRFEALFLGRALIGLGVAACLMAALRTFAQWLDAARLPSINGAMLAVGNAGAMAATVPAVWLLGFTDWRTLFVSIGLYVLAIAAWLAFAVPDPPAAARIAPPSTDDRRDRLASWRIVLSNPYYRAIVPPCALVVAIGLAFQGLWAGPWLLDVARVERQAIGHYLLLVPLGMLLANLLLPRLLERWVERGGAALPFVLAAAGLAVLGQLPFLLSWGSVPALAMLLFGLTHVGGNLVFAALSPLVPAAVVGRLVTTINFTMFFGSFLLQWGMGLVINRFPTAQLGRYEPEGYAAAFGLLLLIEIPAFAWAAWALRRHARSERLRA
ncbi:MAG: MFS transporter [Casimicrobiaceae bacterium]|nr:MFS transporter [Casimicrobiaceae bacterium]